MMKKLIKVLALTILPMMVSVIQAQDIVDSGTLGDNLTWVLTELDDGDEWTNVYQLTISGNGDMADYNSYYNLPWYSHREKIGKVVIAHGVTSIGSSAFESCKSLKEVTIPSSVKSIGKSAFETCYSLKEVEIPNSVVTIGESAFESCGLTSISIPNSITTIGTDVFAYCGNLISVTIPNSVTKIEDYAFIRCGSLPSITIPNSVTSIGQRCFERCSSLTDVSIPNSVTTIGRMAFEECTSLTTVTISSSMTIIGDYVFYGCSSLTSVNIPNSVTSIGSSAFCRCSSLASINIPNSVTSIGSSAFYGCSSLASFVIPNSVTSIGYGAFAECDNLTSITIPKYVTKIGENPFYGCGSLTKLIVENGNPNYDSRDNCNGIIETKTNSLIVGLLNTSIPSTVTCIGSYAFENCSDMTVFNIPNTITSIGERAFYACSSLTSITIPNSVTSIGEEAFASCSSLTSVDIPNSVTSIGNEAFENCSSLTSVHISNSVSFLSGTFGGCSSLTAVVIPNSVKSLDYGAFFNCTSLTSVTIPNSVTKIGYMAFEDCHSLESITIPKFVTEIDTRAFDDCDKLTSITCLALAPPKCSTYCFGYNREPEITLYVPIGCKEKYVAAEIWSKFKEIIEIDVETEPELTLTATVNDGLVTLRFDAVRNDLRHRVVRVDANGVKAKVGSKEGRSYPATIEYVDNPPAGTYTYYAQTAFTDGNGETVSLKSNEVSVIVAEPQSEEQEAKEYVSLLGSIEYDKNMPATGVKVKFSDGVTVDVVGTNFMRAKIPIDTDVTLTVVGDGSHDYEPVNLHIDRAQKPVLLKGVYKTDYVASEEENDLGTCSLFHLYVEGGQHHAKFTVKNRSNEKKWLGQVNVKAVRKNNTPYQIWTDTKPTFYGESEQIEVPAGGTKEVDVVLRGMELDKDTEFIFYLESTGKWNKEGAYTAVATKALIRQDGSDFFSIPFEKTVGKTVLTVLKWNKRSREDFAYLMLGLSSITPGMEGIVGDFTNYQYRNKMVSFAKEFTGKSNEEEAIKALFEWLAGKSPLEAINELNTFNVTSLGFNIITELRKIVLPEKSIFQKFLKDVIITADDIDAATLMLSNVISIVEAVKSKDTFEQVMNCMSVLYSLAAEGNVPLASMMYTYMTAGKTLINAALRLQTITHDSELPERLKANKPRSEAKQGVHDDGVPSYNTTCDFKIIVQTSGLFGSKVDFRKDTYQKQIKDIRVRASNTSTTTTFLCDRKYLDDGIMLQLMRGTCMECPWGIKPGVSEGGSFGLTKFYIEIHWWNDHITVIPLNQGSSGVDIKPGDRGPQFDNEDMKPSLYTITLTTTTGKDHMADELYLGDNKGRN